MRLQAPVTGQVAPGLVGGRSGGYAEEPADRRADRFEIAQEAVTPRSGMWSSTTALSGQGRNHDPESGRRGGHQLDHAKAAEMMKASRASEEGAWSDRANLIHFIHDVELQDDGDGKELLVNHHDSVKGGETRTSYARRASRL